MSIEAISWALNEAPVTDQGQMLVLLGLANHATREGERAFPSVATLAEYARCSVRTAQRHVRALEESGVIVRGDQDWIPAKIPANRRPVVYDLRLDLRRGVTPTSPQSESGVTNEDARGDSPGSSGVTTVSYKPSFFLMEETKDKPTTPVADAPTTQTLVKEWIDNCAATPPQRIVGQVSRHLKALLEEGIPYEGVRRGLQRWHSTSPGVPSQLPNIINEVLNPPTSSRWASQPKPSPAARAQDFLDLIDADNQKAIGGHQ